MPILALILLWSDAPSAGAELAMSATEADEAAGRPLGLAEALGLAVRRSEALAARADGIEEADARIAELRAAVLPRVGLYATQRWQDAAGGDAVTSRFNLSSQRTVWLGARQPLFAGFREFLALRAGREFRAAREADLARARALLELDVAVAYLDLLGSRHALAIRRELRHVMAERVRELEERRRLGRSRAGEVLAARAQQAQLDAQLSRLQGEETAAQERLAFITGLDAPSHPSDVPAPVLPALEALLVGARDRPDVKARRLEEAAAELAVIAARRERWPSLAADGSWYLEREGIQEGVRWDAVLSAQLPLFSGGAVSARVRAAEAARRAAAQHAALAERLAALETRTAHRELESALTTVSALAEAARLAEENGRAQAEDYRLGQVTNLEVLASLNALMESRLQLDDARLTAALAAVRLRVAAGGQAGP